MQTHRFKSALLSTACFLILLLAIFLLFPGLTALAEKTTPAISPTPSTGATPTVTQTTPSPTPSIINLKPVILTSVTITATPTITTTPTPGPTGATPTPTPDPNQTPTPDPAKEELKKQTLEKAKNYLLSKGQPTAEAIDQWLANCHSPQLVEATPDKSIGQTYLEMGWKYGVNPAYAVAFFTKESSCGTSGDNLAAHDFGNIRWTPGYPTIDGVWRAYPDWNSGMEDWFKLLSENYLKGNLTTLADVLPVYAPEIENDTTLYLQQVMDWTDRIMSTSTDREIDLGSAWYCQDTGYRVGWSFLDFWQNNGGEAILGKPISGQIFEGGMVMQYFERAVLEFHPENKAPYQVMLRNLGTQENNIQPPVSVSRATNDGAVYFPQTGHWLAASFAKFWRENGGIARFGYPIAEPEVQGTMLIQWFERARLQLDLQKNVPQVTLGLVGKEALNTKQPFTTVRRLEVPTTSP